MGTGVPRRRMALTALLTFAFAAACLSVLHSLTRPRYALSAQCDVQWDTTPVVRLEMEFRYAPVCAFFSLMIGQKCGAIDVAEILFDDETLDNEAKDERLSAAIASARLQPPRPPRADIFDGIELLGGRAWRKPRASPGQ